MCNNKKIRIKRMKQGTFTMVPVSFTRNINLSPLSKLLLIELFADSDDFEISPRNYCNRLSISSSKYYKYFEELQANGYVKKIDIAKPSKSGKEKKIYFYTLSMYGNLLNEEEKIEARRLHILKYEKKNSKVDKLKLLNDVIAILNEIDDDRIDTVFGNKVIDFYEKEIAENRLTKIVKETIINKILKSLNKKEVVVDKDNYIKNTLEPLFNIKIDKGTIAQIKTIKAQMIDWCSKNNYPTNEKIITDKILRIKNNIVTANRVCTGD